MGKEISSADLVSLLKNPTSEIVQKNEASTEIVFDDYEIKDEHLKYSVSAFNVASNTW